MERFDIIIVGGGIAGASLGARLAGDRQVLLIEAEELLGVHATGRSAAFWQGSLGGDNPAVTLSLASKPMFDAGWPGAQVPLLKSRGALHLTTERHADFDHLDQLPPEYAPKWVGRAELDSLMPGLREHWTGAWLETSCADIDVAAFHAACVAAFKRAGGLLRTNSPFRSASRVADGWEVETASGAVFAGMLVDAAGAWGDTIAEQAGVQPLGLQPRRRTVVQVRVDRGGLKRLPFATDLHDSFYFKGEADNSVWVCPLDETLAEPCDAAPEELDVAIAIDRLEKAVDWRVEAVERKWAGLRTFAPDRIMKFGFAPDDDRFFWCVGQGGMGIQTAPAASLLCATLIEGGAMPPELMGVNPAAFAPGRA